MTNTTKLLEDLISEFESSLKSWNGKPNVLLPSSLQFYHLGLVLADAIDSNSGDDWKPVYQSLLAGFPNSHLRGVLEDLHEAFCKVLERCETTDDITDLEPAVSSLYGLYSAHSKILLAAAATHPIAGWSMSKLQSMESVYQKHKSKRLLLLIALFLEDPTLDFEHLLPAINHLQERKCKSDPSTWEDLVRAVDPEWKERLVGHFTETTQQGYLLSMFQVDDVGEEGPSHAPIGQAKKTKKKAPAPAVKKETPQDTMQRLVGQVRAVFPHLGEGYVETALSHYKGDVERTMSSLVEGQANPASLPVVLQRLDPQLPARWKGPSQKQSAKEEEEAKRITQERAQVMEEQQEAEANAFIMLTTKDEYDDDYDDQYDDVDGYMSRDHGLYDDYDNVRTYNRMMKQEEEERAFWEENRNENRRRKSAGGGDEKKYRGPDKGKGGRIPRAALAQQANSEDEDEGKGKKSNSDDDQPRGGRGGRGGRGRGRGRGGRGRGGRIGRGSGFDKQTESATPSTSIKPGRGAQRHKQNKLDSRRNKQKQANAKRSG